MKIFFKKVWFCLILICLFYYLIDTIYLVYAEQWIEFFKHIIYVLIGSLIGYFELIDVIRWKCIKVFKYNDFN